MRWHQSPVWPQRLLGKGAARHRQGRMGQENPRHYRTAEKALAKAQRRLSRRKKRSKRWGKAVRLLAKKHQEVRRARRDFHHKTTLALLRQYDVVSVEDLRVTNLVRNPQLAKSLSDAGWGQFRTLLECKAVGAGKRVAADPPAFTTQDCSGCGARVPKSLSVRIYVCPSPVDSCWTALTMRR